MLKIELQNFKCNCALGLFVNWSANRNRSCVSILVMISSLTASRVAWAATSICLVQVYLVSAITLAPELCSKIRTRNQRRRESQSNGGGGVNFKNLPTRIGVMIWRVRLNWCFIFLGFLIFLFFNNLPIYLSTYNPLLFSDISERNNDYSDTLDFRRGWVG